MRVYRCRRERLLVAACSIATFPLQSLAQSAPSSTSPLEVVVTASAPVDVYEQPVAQTVTTIDRDLYKDSPAFSIGQVLQYSPGVSIKQGNGPRDVGISIRGSNDRNGFGIRNIQVLEDGFPVTQPDGLSRTDLTDPHAYAGIDVYRGPSSVLFGNYATGGAINFRTRTGGDIRGFEIGSDVGNFGYFNGYLAFGDEAGPYDYSVFGSYVRGDGFIANSAFNTGTENILASYAPTASDKFTLKIINNDISTQLPIRLSLNQFNQNPFQKGCSVANPALGCGSVTLFANGTNGATVAQSASQAGLSRSDRRTIGGVRWEHAIDTQTDWRTTLVFDNKDIKQPTGATAALGDTPAFNVISDVTRRSNLLGLETTHFAGVYFNYEDLNSYTYNLRPGGGALLGALTSDYFGHQYNAGVRAREEIAFSPRWTGVGGVAVEYTDISALNTNFAYPVGRAPSQTQLSVRRDFVNVAYEAGLRFRPDDQWQFRGRVASAYGTPQAGNLFVTPQGVAGNNTQLKTQTNQGIDLGADWTLGNVLAISVTGFYEFFKNELVTQSPGAGLQSFTFNAPASEHRGVELLVDWRPLPGWRFRTAYTYDDQYYTEYVEQLSAGARTATFNRAGKKIPGVQPHNLTARLGYDQPSGWLTGLGAFAEVNWRGDFFIDNANLVKASGYHLVNLNAHYDSSNPYSVFKGISLFFEIQNLLDETYIASANNVSDLISAVTGTQNPATTVAAATGSIYAGAPRTFIGGIRAKF
jgi:iron complex outermembrane receptor protein